MARLHVLCWQQAYIEILPADFLRDLSVEKRAEGWQRTLEDEEVFALVACDGDRIVGFVTAGPARGLDANTAALADGEIYAIYNHQDFYRRGIGKHFLAAAARFWQSKNGRSFLVLFLAQNRRAEQFYNTLGGTPVYSGPLEIGGVIVDDCGYVFSDLASLALLTPSPSHG